MLASRQLINTVTRTRARVHGARVAGDVRLDWSVQLVHAGGLCVGPGTEIRRNSSIELWGQPDESIQIGAACRIKENVWLASYGGSIEIGDRVLVGRNAVIYGHGGVTIGADSLLGPGVVVASSDHVFWDEGPIQAQGFTREPILIGEDVWLGAATVVCPGISIDSHVVVGAGSIVTQNLVGGMVYGGVPAVQLGTISDRKAGSIRRHFLPGAANDS